MTGGQAEKNKKRRRLWWGITPATGSSGLLCRTLLGRCLAVPSAWYLRLASLSARWRRPGTRRAVSMRVFAFVPSRPNCDVGMPRLAPETEIDVDLRQDSAKLYQAIWSFTCHNWLYSRPQDLGILRHLLRNIQGPLFSFCLYAIDRALQDSTSRSVVISNFRRCVLRQSPAFSPRNTTLERCLYFFLVSAFYVTEPCQVSHEAHKGTTRLLPSTPSELLRIR